MVDNPIRTRLELNKQVQSWSSPCSPREQVLHDWCYLIYKNPERMQISSLWWWSNRSKTFRFIILTPFTSNTQIFQIEHKLIRFSTSGSLTSLVNLHNAVEELNLGLLTTNPSIDKGFEPGTSRSLVQHLRQQTLQGLLDYYFYSFSSDSFNIVQWCCFKAKWLFQTETLADWTLYYEQS